MTEVTLIDKDGDEFVVYSCTMNNASTCADECIETCSPIMSLSTNCTVNSNSAYFTVCYSTTPFADINAPGPCQTIFTFEAPLSSLPLTSDPTTGTLISTILLTPGYYYIHGLAYIDTNGNNIPDAGDITGADGGASSTNLCIHILDMVIDESDVSISPAPPYCVGQPITFTVNDINSYGYIHWLLDNVEMQSCEETPPIPTPVELCETFTFTPTSVGTYTITLDAGILGIGGCEVYMPVEFPITVGDGACCLDPQSPCCLDPEGSVCCVAQSPPSGYLWFDATGDVVPAGTSGATLNYNSPSGTFTWTSGVGNHPFGNYAGTAADPIRINGDLNISPWTRTTMNNLHFAFGPTGRVQVRTGSQSGGILTLNNCRLTGEPNCHTMWQGIRVMGPGTGQQRFRDLIDGTRTYGIANLNNTLVRDAIVGIAAMTFPIIPIENLQSQIAQLLEPQFNTQQNGIPPSVTSQVLWGITSAGISTAGGLCRLNNSDFFNCLEGANFSWYNNVPPYYIASNPTATLYPNDICTVFNTQFRSDANMAYPLNINNSDGTAFRTETGIEMLMYSRLRITGVISDSAPITHFSNVKFGIRAVEAHRINVGANIFSNCQVGISSLASQFDPLTENFTLKGNILNACNVGIQASGSNMTINTNTFNPINLSPPGIVGGCRIGILLRSCDFEVVYNKINKYVNGVVLMSNYTTPNSLHLNHFTSNAVDVWAFGNNGDPVGGGTQIYCNNFDHYLAMSILVQPYNPIGTSVFPPEPGAVDDQGDCAVFSSTIQIPADNTFTENTPGLFEIFADNGVPNFTYYARPDVGSTIYTPPTVTSNVIVQPCIPPLGPITICNGSPPKPESVIKSISNPYERNTEAMKKLYAYWDEGTIDSATIANLFKDLGTDLSLRKMLPYYAAQNDAVKFEETMGQLPDSDLENQYFKQLQQLNWQIRQSGRTFMQLNATEEALVRQIAQSGTRAAFDAHTLLFLLYGEEFSVPLPILPLPVAALVGYAEQGSFSFKTATNALSTPIQVLPNPAQNTVCIKHTLQPNQQPFMLYCYGSDSRLMYRNQVLATESINIDISEWPNGVYFLQLQTSTGEMHSQKMTILR